MKVKDLIELLKTYDQELTVCLADWQEDYLSPSESVVEQIAVVTGDYYPVPVFRNPPDDEFQGIGPEFKVRGTFLKIGDSKNG